jgi:hypothetical protein
MKGLANGNGTHASCCRNALGEGDETRACKQIADACGQLALEDDGEKAGEGGEAGLAVKADLAQEVHSEAKRATC